MYPRLCRMKRSRTFSMSGAVVSQAYPARPPDPAGRHQPDVARVEPVRRPRRIGVGELQDVQIRAVLRHDPALQRHRPEQPQRQGWHMLVPPLERPVCGLFPVQALQDGVHRVDPGVLGWRRSPSSGSRC